MVIVLFLIIVVTVVVIVIIVIIAIFVIFAISRYTMRLRLFFIHLTNYQRHIEHIFDIENC